MAAGITRCVRRDYATTCIHRVLQVEEDATIYDEVTEDQYKSIVRGRLAKDDFVVDDGVGGYMDNGMDDFEEKEDDSMSEEDIKKSKCACCLHFDIFFTRLTRLL